MYRGAIFKFRITPGYPGRDFSVTHRLARQKSFPEICQASQAEFKFPAILWVTQNSLTAVISYHKMFDISPMCRVYLLKKFCTLSGGPTLPALQVSLNFENCKYGFWIWTGFQA